MRNTFLILFSTIILSSCNLISQNSIDPIHVACHYLNIDSSTLNKKFISSSYINKGKLLFILPEIIEQEGDEYTDMKGHIVLYDTQKEKVLHTITSKQNWTSDAISIIGIDFDSIGHILSNGTTCKAFKIKEDGSSRVNPYYAEQLYLVNLYQDSIAFQLEHFPINQHNGEWNGMCEGWFTNKKTDYSFSNELVLFKDSVTYTTQKSIENDCISIDSIYLENRSIKIH